MENRIEGSAERFAEPPPALVLNADYRPLSHFPLSLAGWQTAVRATVLDRVHVVKEYDRVIRSARMELRLPSVIALKKFRRPRGDIAFTRFNLFLRDGFQCQYCGRQGSAGTLSFDHVVPRALGGETEWGNVVAACIACNSRKGAKRMEDAGMSLARKPGKPTHEGLERMGRRFPPRHLHETWMDFVYWDAPLEP